MIRIRASSARRTMADPKKSAPQAVPRTRLERFWLEWVKPLLVVGSILLSFRSSIADWNDVPSGSMKPTILEGDRVFVNKLAYDLKVPFASHCTSGWSCVLGIDLWAGGPAVQLARWGDPQRGDIVVLWSPHDGKRLVKRVVALPGDRLQVVRQQLVVNGQPASYAPLSGEVQAHAGVEGLPLDQMSQETVEGRTHAVMWFSAEATNASVGPIEVPPGQYFVMGDHRDDSFDSRFFGFIERPRIVGRAVAVVASLDIKNGWGPRWKRFFSRLI
jgi:signal peptidase I